MVIFPNCKINLGLRILRKRADGYHDLETVFYPVPLTDVLEILPSPLPQPECELSGLPVPGDPAQNLCLKAWHLLKRDFPELPAVRCWLHKIIPTGAGLGGGSADGAFMLKALNDLFRLSLSQEQLMDYALKLGSDCPFFLMNQPALASGRGEQLRPVSLDLSGYSITLVFPGIPISTAWAFQQIRPQEPEGDSLETLITQPLSTWAGRLVNDFEAPVFSAHPEIAAIRDTLYEAGAEFAALSGSGSTVFGLSRQPLTFPRPFPSSYFVKQAVMGPFSSAGKK